MGSRPFANNNNINFNDYINNKKSIEKLKNIQSQNRNLNQFLSYSDFIQLTKTFYKYSNVLSEIINEPLSLYDSPNSTIIYNNVINHIQNCSYCKRCQNSLQITNCKEIKNTLYSLYNLENGLNKKKNGILFPSKINIQEWCKYSCSQATNTPCSKKTNVSSLPSKQNLSRVRKNNAGLSKNNNSNSYKLHFSNNLNNLNIIYVEEDPNVIHVESLLIAFFSNIKETVDCKEYSIRFKTIYLEYDYFKTLFYSSPLGNFHVADTNHYNIILLLSSQLYLDIQFDLFSTLLKAYEELFFKSRNSIPMETIVLLNKEVNLLLSIFDFNEKQVTLNLVEDVIPTLQNKIIFLSSNTKDEAYVTFTINIMYYCKTLDFNLSMNFYYKTGITGFVCKKDGWKNIQNNIAFSDVNPSKLNNKSNNLCGSNNICKYFVNKD